MLTITVRVLFHLIGLQMPLVAHLVMLPIFKNVDMSSIDSLHLRIACLLQLSPR